MLAVLMDTKTDDAVRRRAYVGLERVYKVLGKNPPDYLPVATVAKLDLPERLGMFWEGETSMIEAKAEMGSISPEITLLKAAYAALEQAEAHQAMAGAAIAQSESLITTVLESLGVMLPPEEAEPPEGEMPSEDMGGMTEMSAAPATVTYNAEVFRAFLEGATK
jgi:DNA segregation ATPase FtsK/SpoIIIE-like protein